MSNKRALSLQALRLFAAGDCRAEYSAALLEAWVGGNDDLHHEAKAVGVSITDLLRAAAFQTPSDLPEAVPVWRAAQTRDLARALGGRSWSTNQTGVFNLAGCYVFLRQAVLVVRRTIERDRIIFYHEARPGVAEVVFDAPNAGEVDGTEADWLGAFKAYANQHPHLRAMVRR